MGCCAHGNKPCGSVEDKKCLDQVYCGYWNGALLQVSSCQNFGRSVFFSQKTFCAGPRQIHTARTARLQQVSCVCGMWKSVVLHNILGSHSVKPQKTDVTNCLMFVPWPYGPICLAKKQLMQQHQLVLWIVPVMPFIIFLISWMEPHKGHKLHAIKPCWCGISPSTPSEGWVHTHLPPDCHIDSPCTVYFLPVDLLPVYSHCGNPLPVKCISIKCQAYNQQPKLMPWPWGLVVGLSPWRSRFNARPGYGGFVVDKVVVGWVVLQVLWVLPL